MEELSMSRQWGLGWNDCLAHEVSPGVTLEDAALAYLALLRIIQSAPDGVTIWRNGDGDYELGRWASDNLALLLTDQADELPDTKAEA